MRHFLFKIRLVIFLACSAAVAFGSNAAEDWLPVNAQELQAKEFAGAAGAPAIILYFADFIYDDAHEEFFYIRIKILTSGGLRFSDVEIPVYPGTKIRDLMARTIRSDGSLVPVTAEPYERLIAKGRGFKLNAQTFTFPDVSPGSIIEYKYKVHGAGLDQNRWVLEHDLFAVKQHFLATYKSPAHFLYIGSPGVTARPTEAKEKFELDLENTAPFVAEEQMPPEENYKQGIRFVRGFSGAATGTELYWAFVTNAASREAQEFIGDHKEVKELAAATIAGINSREMQLRKLYTRAQQVRNLTYERDRSGQEQKKEQLKVNKNIADVLQHGYGNAAEINFLFVGLARAAGFEANPLLVASRRDRFFRRELRDPSQFNGVISAVSLNGKDIYLDPGTRFCPFGLIRWMWTATEGVKLQKTGTVSFQLPSMDHNHAVITRNADLKLAADGRLRGELDVRYESGEALERRLLALSTDEAGRRKALEDEVKSWLPPNAAVSMANSAAWEDQDSPLVAQFSIDVPGYAAVAGTRVLIPVSLFPSREKGAFRNADRKYPVYFPYAFTEHDYMAMKLPEGFTIENLPAPGNANIMPFAHYSLALKTEANVLRTERELIVNGILFDRTSYLMLREFFNRVQLGDESQASLRQKSAN
jgi:hypothetical protein